MARFGFRGARGRVEWGLRMRGRGVGLAIGGVGFVGASALGLVAQVGAGRVVFVFESAVEVE